MKTTYPFDSVLSQREVEGRMVKIWVIVSLYILNEEPCYIGGRRPRTLLRDQGHTFATGSWRGRLVLASMYAYNALHMDLQYGTIKRK